MRARVALVAVLATLPLATHAEVSWSPKRAVMAGLAGSQDTARVQFTSSVDLEDVEVRVAPTLARYVSAIPESFAHIPAGEPQTITLALTVPKDSVPRHLTGTIHLAEPRPPHVRQKHTLVTTRPLLVNVAVQPPLLQPGSSHGLVFGPTRLVRGTGAPLENRFEVSPEGFQEPFVLFVRNGTADGRARVSSALITLDGQLLFQPRDFSQQKPGRTVPVALRAPSVLDVRLAGSPGSELTIWIAGNPNLDVELDQAAVASQVISSDGGTVSAVGGDGTSYSLSIPAGAVVEPVQVSATPIASIPNLPFSGGFLYGVHLQPEGLTLLRPGILTVVPATSIPLESRRGFAYGGQGSDFHAYPFLADDASLRIPITHFSGYGVGAGNSADDLQVAATAPVGTQDSYEAAIAAIVAGDPALPPDAVARVVSLLRDWFFNLVMGSLEEVAACSTQDCPALLQRVQDTVSIWARWKGFVDALGLADNPDLTDLLSGFDQELKRLLVDALARVDAQCAAQTDFCARVSKAGEVWAVLAGLEQLCGPVGWLERDSVCGGVVPRVMRDLLPPFSIEVHRHRIAEATLFFLTEGHQTVEMLENLDLQWSSMDESVAVVRPEPGNPRVGLIFGNELGSTGVRVTATQCGIVKERNIAVTVSSEVARVSFVPPSLQLDTDQKTRVIVVLYDNEGTEVPAGEYPLVWRTDPEGLVGLSPLIDVVANRWVLDVSALSPGQATVTAIEPSSGVSAALTVRVGSPIKITPSERTVMVYDGMQASFTVTRTDGGPVPWYEVVWTIPEEVPAWARGGTAVVPYRGELATPGTYELHARVGRDTATATLTVLPKAFYMGDVTHSATVHYVDRTGFHPTCGYGDVSGPSTGWMVLDPLPTYPRAYAGGMEWDFWVTGPSLTLKLLSGQDVGCESRPFGRDDVRRSPSLFLRDRLDLVDQFADVTSAGVTAYQLYQNLDPNRLDNRFEGLLTASYQPHAWATGTFSYSTDGSPPWDTVRWDVGHLTGSLSFTVHSVAAQQFCETVPVPVFGCGRNSFSWFSGSAPLQLTGSLEPYVLRVSGYIDDFGGSATISGSGVFGCHDSGGVGFCDRCDPVGALPNLPDCRYMDLTDVTIPLVRQGNVVSGSGGDEPNVIFNGAVESGRLNGTVVWSKSSASSTISVSWPTAQSSGW